MTIAEKIGFIEDPFRKDETAVHVVNALRWVREKSGPNEEKKVLEEIINHIPNQSQHQMLKETLYDENGWIGIWVHHLSLEIVRERLEIDQESFYKGLGQKSLDGSVNMWAKIVTNIVPVRLIYSECARTSKNYSTVIDMTMIEESFIDGKPRIVLERRSTKEYLDEMHSMFTDDDANFLLKNDCLLTHGVLEYVPTLSKGPKAKVIHEYCEAEGKGACIYQIEYKTRLIDKLFFSWPFYGGREREKDQRIIVLNAKIREAIELATKTEQELAQVRLEIAEKESYADGMTQSANTFVHTVRGNLMGILSVTGAVLESVYNFERPIHPGLTLARDIGCSNKELLDIRKYIMQIEDITLTTSNDDLVNKILGICETRTTDDEDLEVELFLMEQYLRNCSGFNKETINGLKKAVSGGQLILDKIKSFDITAQQRPYNPEKISSQQYIYEFFNTRYDASVELDIKLQEMYFDKEDLTEILELTIQNAIESNDEKKAALGSDYKEKVIIKVYSQDNQGIIEIKDNGVGIDPAKRDKVFDAGQSTKDNLNHSGIGLYRVNQLLIRNNATLQFIGPYDQDDITTNYTIQQMRFPLTGGII